MGFSLTSSAPEKGDPTAKNRVWEFFGDAQEMHRQNRPQTKQPRQGNRLTTTKIALGRTYWPSRDPIVERGGVNLYGFVNNKAVNWIDLFGREGVDGVNPGHLPGGGLAKIEDDAGRLSKLAAARQNAKSKTWDSRDEAGIFGATLSLSLTFHGPRTDVGYSVFTMAEYGGRVCCKCKVEDDCSIKLIYSISPPSTNLWRKKINPTSMDRCPEGSEMVGGYHSHPFAAGFKGDVDQIERHDRHYQLIRDRDGLKDYLCKQAHPLYKEYVGDPKDGEVYQISAFSQDGKIEKPFGIDK